MNTPYGPDLASRVADLLDRGGAVMHHHRDYCGMGLLKADGEYRYGEVWEGWLDHPTQRWATRERFTAWLARQSDHSLSRARDPAPFYRQNQVITRQRLQAAVGG